MPKQKLQLCVSLLYSVMVGATTAFLLYGSIALHTGGSLTPAPQMSLPFCGHSILDAAMIVFRPGVVWCGVVRAASAGGTVIPQSELEDVCDSLTGLCMFPAGHSLLHAYPLHGHSLNAPRSQCSVTACLLKLLW
jgi:hypothetical protein